MDNLGQRFAKCSIICVDNSIMLHEFAGILRKEDIRAQEKEKVQRFSWEKVLSRTLIFLN